MYKLLVVVVGALAGCLAVEGIVQGGAKDGKIRWSHKKTGNCNCLPAIEVPPAVDGKPGVWTTKVAFKANQLAEFFVIGDGDTDLDLYVKDSGGNIVVKDADPPAGEGGGSDLCVCRWKPSMDEEFTIIIANQGPIANIALAGCN